MPGALTRLRAAVERAGRTWPDGGGPSLAELLALLVLLAGSVALTAVVWWGSRGTPVEEDVRGLSSGLPGTPTAVPTGAEPPAGVATPLDQLVVHVAGEVGQPGVRRLPAGSRVVDAVEAAGGATAAADLSQVNLARPLVDGEQVRVPAVGEVVVAAPQVAGPAGDPPHAGPLDLNTATSAQLQELPGIGEVTAQRIIDHRASIGGFADVAQLLEVPGIGPGRFTALQELVVVR